MQLLKPEDVKEARKKRTDESKERLWAAAAEENKLLRRINHLKDEEKKKFVALKELPEDLETLHLRVLKNQLTNEVVVLEKRRGEALKPVGELMAQAKELIAANETEKTLLCQQKEAMRTRETEIMEKMDDLSDAGQILNERAAKLDKRESKISEGENELKRSTNTLSEKWIVFHSDVNKKNLELSERERIVAEHTQANNDMLKTFAAKEKELADRELALTDKYRTLVKASEEFEKMKHEFNKKR